MSDNSIVAFYQSRKTGVDKIIDQTFFQLLTGTEAIDSIIPSRNYLSRKLLLVKFKRHKPTIASVVGENQEIPATRPRATLSEDLFGNLKVGKKLVFEHEHFEMMHEMQMYLNSSGAMASQMVTEIERYFFGLAADLVPALDGTALMLALKVATTGTCTYTDPLTGAKVELTYPGTESTLLPSALTSGNRWTQPSTADGLTNLETHAKAYYDIHGVFPPKLILHFSDFRDLASQNSTKIAKLRRSGADSTAPDVTGVYIEDAELIDMIRARVRCDEVIFFDAMYSEEQKNSSDPLDKYFLPEHYYFFGEDDLIERAYVPTVEKDFQPGVYLDSERVSKSPRKEQTVACANVLPFIGDPRKIAARKVA
ncbi:hypothetical protein [Pantanalinema sp. GBBB05]|uniref:hypothetical protein n=1 Tax=Pantanalinema sp. GBBB05 TaxID=2604139 RepID=UPI001D7999D4|nr:hypothetical protein [Pantanalinema sp. GBBB05]